MAKIRYSRKEWREEYLKSVEWIEKRNSFMKDKKNCERCHNFPATDAHHCNYRNIINVKNKDLLAVCRKCHNILELAKKQELLKHNHTRNQAISFDEKLFNKRILISKQILDQIPTLTSNGIRRIRGLFKISDHINLIEFLSNKKISRKIFNKLYGIIKNNKHKPFKKERHSKQGKSSLLKRVHSPSSSIQIHY